MPIHRRGTEEIGFKDLRENVLVVLEVEAPDRKILKALEHRYIPDFNTGSRLGCIGALNVTLFLTYSGSLFGICLGLCDVSSPIRDVVGPLGGKCSLAFSCRNRNV